MNVSIDIIGPNAFSDLSSSSPMLLPTKQIHVLTQNKGRGKSRSKLCYLLHLEKLARLLKPTAKKMFHLYCRCYQNIQNQMPSSWSEQQPIHGMAPVTQAMNERLGGSHHWRIVWSASCWWRWSLVTTWRTAQNVGPSNLKKKTLQGDEMSVLMAKVTGSSQTQQVATFFLAEETLHTAWRCLSSGFPTWKFSRIAIRS